MVAINLTGTILSRPLAMLKVPLVTATSRSDYKETEGKERKRGQLRGWAGEGDCPRRKGLPKAPFHCRLLHCFSQLL